MLRQLDRALDNVEALLRAGEANLADMTHLIVYLRDPSDYLAVQRRLVERFPELPLLIVQGRGLPPGMADRGGGHGGRRRQDARLDRVLMGVLGLPRRRAAGG